MVESVAVFVNGKRVITECADNTADFCVVGAGQEPKTLAGHADVMKSVAVFADGERVITSSADYTAKICALGAGQ